MMRILTYILFLICLFSCATETVDRKAFLNAELDRRVSKYENTKMEICRNKINEEISIEVDSMMFYLVQKMRGLSNEMPQRPDRPGRLVDSIELEVNQ